MTTITKIPFTAPAGFEERELAVDSLNVREAVIGDGLMLTQKDDRINLHAIGMGRAELIGSYKSAGDAFAALDELDTGF